MSVLYEIYINVEQFHNNYVFASKTT